MTDPSPTIRRILLPAAALAACGLAGCVVAPPPRPAPPVVQAPPPDTDVYAYPMRSQSAQQQDRDHYECSQWATGQTGFNPSAPGVPAQERVRVVSGPPPGTGTAIGAITGAIIGAAIANPWETGTGALAGALVGGAIGTASDAANAQQTRTVVVADRRAAAIERRQAANYRRAISACLDARGYSVK